MTQTCYSSSASSWARILNFVHGSPVFVVHRTYSESQAPSPRLVVQHHAITARGLTWHETRVPFDERVAPE